MSLFGFFVIVETEWEAGAKPEGSCQPLTLSLAFQSFAPEAVG